MQSPLQKNVTLNPSYTGPGVIEEYVRKVKSQSSLGRMISTFNKRYLVLDLTRLAFYYLPEKGSHFSNAVDVPLDSITRVYIDGQLQLLGGENDTINTNMWKYAFVVVTKKRVYRLITHSNVVLERYLFGFSNVVNTETNRPLFDWSSHKQGSEPASPLYKMINANAEDRSPSGQSPAVNQNQQYKDDSNQRKDTEPSPVDKKPRRYSHGIPYQQEKQEKEKRSEAPAQDKKIEINTKESRDDMSPQLKDNMMFRGNTYGKTTAGNDSELRQHQFSNNRMTSMDESPHIVEHHSNFHVSRFEQDKRQAAESIKAKMDVVSLDEPEKEVIEARGQRRSSSVRRDSSVRRNSSVNAQREQGSASRTAVQARKNESEIGFVGFNQVDLAQYQKKKTSSNFWDEDPLDKSASKMSLVRQKTREYPERKMNIGNGIQVSFPKFEEISGKQDLPASYISMMQEAKKFSPVIHDERGREGPVRSGNGISVSVVKNNGNDDDDWDKEMFGDEDEKDRAGKSMGKGINKDLSSNTLTGFQDPRLSQVKKNNQLFHKKSEIMASREEAYNDWDDDM